MYLVLVSYSVHPTLLECGNWCYIGLDCVLRKMLRSFIFERVKNKGILLHLFHPPPPPQKREEKTKQKLIPIKRCWTYNPNIPGFYIKPKTAHGVDTGRAIKRLLTVLKEAEQSRFKNGYALKNVHQSFLKILNL